MCHLLMSQQQCCSKTTKKDTQTYNLVTETHWSSKKVSALLSIYSLKRLDRKKTLRNCYPILPSQKSYFCEMMAKTMEDEKTFSIRDNNSNGYVILFLSLEHFNIILQIDFLSNVVFYLFPAQNSISNVF